MTRLTRLRGAVAAARSAVLTVAGLGCLDVAAFQVHLVAGLSATGVSLLVFEWLTKEGGDRA